MPDGTLRAETHSARAWRGARNRHLVAKTGRWATCRIGRSSLSRYPGADKTDQRTAADNCRILGSRNLIHHAIGRSCRWAADTKRGRSVRILIQSRRAQLIRMSVADQNHVNIAEPGIRRAGTRVSGIVEDAYTRRIFKDERPVGRTK